VRFADGIEAMTGTGVGVALELGPGGVLSALGRDNAPQGIAFVPTLRDAHREPESLVGALAHAHAAGIPVDWPAYFAGHGREVDLPTYAFQCQRFWPDAALRDSTVDEPHRRQPDPYRYELGWERLRPTLARDLTGTWLLVATDEPSQAATADLISAALSAHGARTATAVIDAATLDRTALAERLSAELAGNPTLAAHQPTGILSLLALSDPSTVPTTPPGLARTLTLVQALGDTDLAAPLWCLTRNAVAEETDHADPAQAAVWGLGRVAAAEHAARWGGLIDLPDKVDAVTGDQLVRVLTGTDDEEQVALRPSGILAGRLTRALEREPSDHAWTPTGTVLVTGGTGRVGAELARRLARRGAPHLLLVSRRGPYHPKAEELQAELTGLGARVTVVAADVADRQRMSAVLAERAVTAVFHAAGSIDDEFLGALDENRLVQALHPTVGGALVLDELTGSLPLSAFVLCASTAGTLGSPGRGARAAADAQLAAIARRRRSRGLTATVAAWGPWSRGAEPAADSTGTRRRPGMFALPPAVALDTVIEAVEHDDTAVTVADIEWRGFARAFLGDRRRPYLRGLLVAEGDGRSEPTPAEHDRSAAPRLRERLATLATTEQHGVLTELVCARVAAALGYPSSNPISPHQRLLDLGIDSLSAVEIRNGLNLATGLTLATSAVFDHPTPAALATRLLDELTAQAQPAETDALPRRGGG
ncbi:SDR family NAD(P)-dependent oxidoreductase, partial [Solihabitans fulvus]